MQQNIKHFVKQKNCTLSQLVEGHQFVRDIRPCSGMAVLRRQLQIVAIIINIIFIRFRSAQGALYAAQPQFPLIRTIESETSVF